MSTEDQLQDDVERVRAELGETVAALAAKADVRRHARNAADRVKTGTPRPVQGGVIVGTAALVCLGAWAWIRRQDRRSRLRRGLDAARKRTGHKVSAMPSPQVPFRARSAK